MWLTARVVPPATPTIVSYDAETLTQQGTGATEQESVLILDEVIQEKKKDLCAEASYLPGHEGATTG